MPRRHAHVGLALSVLVLLVGCQAAVTDQPATPGTTVSTAFSSSTTARSAAGTHTFELRPVVQWILTAPLPSAAQPSALPSSTDLSDPTSARQIRQSTDRNVQMQALVALDCTADDPLRGRTDPHLPLVSCGADRAAKYILEPAALNADDIANAEVINPTGPGYGVSLDFTTPGAAKWAQLTAQNVGQQIAFTLDGAILSAPTIAEALTSGTSEISGPFTHEQAQQLADDIIGR